jgi:glycosyltransferase involved in cell wall biosynthesis
MNDVTAITVVCNTPEIFDTMYRAFRKFHRQTPLIVIDNSDAKIQPKIAAYASDITTVYQFVENIGHGRGLNFAIQKVKTKYVLIMDTDTIILKDPVKEMLKLFTPETYGVGCITEVGKDGYDFRAFKSHKVPIPYLHPFFAMIRVSEFFKHKPFVHHGAPWYKVAVELHEINQSNKIIHFNGLKAFDKAPDGRLIAARTEYVFHDFGSTRRQLKSMGRDEIPQGWAL